VCVCLSMCVCVFIYIYIYIKQLLRKYLGTKSKSLRFSAQRSPPGQILYRTADVSESLQSRRSQQHSVNYNHDCSIRITLKLIKEYDRQLSVLKLAVYRLRVAAVAISDVRHFRLTLPL